MRADGVHHLGEEEPSDRPPVKPPGLLRRKISAGWLFFAGALLVLALIPLSLWLTISADSVQSQNEQIKTEVGPLASAAQNACARPDSEAARDLGPAACSQASKVQSIISATPVPGPQGERGEQGEEGRGVTGTAISNEGHLIISYTDGTSRDVGRVVGADGAKGDTGRGILGTAIVTGRLVISYTDGTTQDVGRVVGPRGEQGETGATGEQGPEGRGVASTSTVGGRLVVTYTDGTSEDAGPLPAGPAGPAGDSVVGQDFVWDGDTCRNQITYASGRTELRGTADDAACPPRASVTMTTPTGQNGLPGE